MISWGNFQMTVLRELTERKAAVIVPQAQGLLGVVGHWPATTNAAAIASTQLAFSLCLSNLKWNLKNKSQGTKSNKP